jgi:hypothetical protein
VDSGEKIPSLVNAASITTAAGGASRAVSRSAADVTCSAQPPAGNRRASGGSIVST